MAQKKETQGKSGSKKPRVKVGDMKPTKDAKGGSLRSPNKFAVK